jgi:chromosome segregation ATPase
VSREELIARKGEVQAQIAQASRRLEQARQEVESTSGLRRRWLVARVAQLETRLDSLRTEEGRLRQLIDRTRP